MEQPSLHPYSQKAVIESIDGPAAKLRLPDGQILHWKKNTLPLDAKAGDEIRIILHSKKTEDEERGAIARTLLNEIFTAPPPA
jgi:hypothetical protein